MNGLDFQPSPDTMPSCDADVERRKAKMPEHSHVGFRPEMR